MIKWNYGKEAENNDNDNTNRLIRVKNNDNNNDHTKPPYPGLTLGQYSFEK